MYFASDNTAGIAPEILAAIGMANTGYALGYGNDEWTKRVGARFAEISNVSHFAMLQDPASFNALLDTFLDG